MTPGELLDALVADVSGRYRTHCPLTVSVEYVPGTRRLVVMFRNEDGEIWTYRREMAAVELSRLNMNADDLSAALLEAVHCAWFPMQYLPLGRESRR